MGIRRRLMSCSVPSRLIAFAVCLYCYKRLSSVPKVESGNCGWKKRKSDGRGAIAGLGYGREFDSDIIITSSSGAFE